MFTDINKYKQVYLNITKEYDLQFGYEHVMSEVQNLFICRCYDIIRHYYTNGQSVKDTFLGHFLLVKTKQDFPESKLQCILLKHSELFLTQICVFTGKLLKVVSNHFLLICHQLSQKVQHSSFTHIHTHTHTHTHMCVFSHPSMMFVWLFVCLFVTTVSGIPCWPETHQVTQDDLEFLTFLLSSPKYWDYNCALRKELRDLGLWDKHSIK